MLMAAPLGAPMGERLILLNYLATLNKRTCIAGGNEIGKDCRRSYRSPMHLGPAGPVKPDKALDRAAGKPPCFYVLRSTHAVLWVFRLPRSTRESKPRCSRQ